MKHLQESNLPRLNWIIAFLILVLIPVSKSFSEENLSANVMNLLAKAEAGDVDAQFKVGSAYDTGQGAPRDGAAAKKWYLLAANSGSAEAQNSIGSIMQAENKYEEARSWYEKASVQNHALATNNLAYLYDMGLGVKQDKQKGFELYLKAANLGWAEAMWNIANMYGAGQLGEKDLYAACLWSLRAKKYAKPTDDRLNAQLNRIVPYLEHNLTSGDFERCNKEAGTWLPH